LARLGDTDRNAILLRYFEQKSLREVGVSLGLREEAAKKRVARALEKLRRMLKHRGTEISAAALVAGLTKETAEAASAIPLAGKMAATVFARGAASAGASAGSALLNDVLAALRWQKMLKVSGAVIGLITVTLLLPLAAHYWQTPGNSLADSTNSSTLVRSSEQRNQPNRFTASLGKDAESYRTLVVTVLDAKTGEPIEGAMLTPYVNGVTVPEFQNPFKTGPDGLAKLPLPM